MTSGIIGFSAAMRARQDAERTTLRREGMAEGYREGVSDGLKLAASVCNSLGRGREGWPFADIGAADCVLAIRALIESGDYTAQPLAATANKPDERSV